MLGFVVTAEETDALYLRGYEEAVHHSLVLRVGPSRRRGVHGVPGVGAGRPRPRRGAGTANAAAPSSVDRRAPRAASAPAVRVLDPLGFTRRVLRREHPHATDSTNGTSSIAAPTSHASTTSTSVSTIRGRRTTTSTRWASVAPRRSRTSTTTACTRAWMHRKPSVHDVAFTFGTSPRLHHTGFFVPEQHYISTLCDHVRRDRAAAPHRTWAGPTRRVQRVLRLPARPRRSPHRDLHQRLLHR